MSEWREVHSKLKAGLYPQRHIEGLDGLYGESLAKAEALWPKVKQKDCLLVLCGDRGRGKTQMVTYWGARLAKSGKGHRGLYFKAHDLLETIREKYSSDHHTAREAKKLLKRVESTLYLVIDEHSELAGTEWERRTLTTIIDKRYDAQKATVLCTNTDPDKVAGEVGRSVFSRAQEVGGVVHCNWDSYRGRQAPQN